METVNEYTKNERVAKYAILIIALTFMIFFFSEMVQGLRFHPLQYLLVGLALSLFYVLLLSFSEHIGFNAAYLVSAAATIALIAYYAGSTARSRPFGIRLALLLTAIFGFIFTILQMEDFALLAGSLGLFTALAAVMHYSRHIDWTGRGNMPEPAEEIE
jgi:inner membrane protein